MSGGNKAVELQLQMRQNAEELQDFMKELDSWETDIKKKDEQLRSGSSCETEQRSLPPVRNKDYRQKKREKNKPPTKNAKNQPKQPRIKSYDYQAWDKFDVSKALETMDKEDSPEQSESDSEGVPIDRDLALAEKEKGNRLFKEGKYDDAIDCYTRGMSADPYNPVLPTNRATCFFRLKKYAVAESDCNLAIALDRSYTKAYARRGATRFALQKFESALEDYEMVLKLDPENLDAQNEVRKVKEALSSQEVKADRKEAPAKESPAAKEGEQEQIKEQQTRQQAVMQKDLGNAYFKEGKYEAAVECYTKGMEADATNALLPANRAMAYLKLQKYKEAEDDCSKAIALDGTYTKAFARRGSARAALGRLREAKEDFEQVLKLEPGNKQAVDELKKITSDIAASGLTTEQATADSQSTRRTVQPINKPPHLRSTKPLRRIDIEEVGGEITVLEKRVMATPSTCGGAAPPPSAAGDHAEEASPLGGSPCAKIQKIEEISDSPAPPPKCPEEGHATDRPVKQKKENLTNQEGALSVNEPVSIPSLPANSFQLEADLRKLKNHPDKMYKYLKQIEPDMYPKVFQNSLEPDILNQILGIFQCFYIKYEAPSLILEILKNLATVRRFDMAVMFMSSTEKKVLQDLFDCLRQAGLEDEPVKALQKKYGV
ncbi:RNA polymerase II-associated protein 3 isoform X2 [Megalops cyprinoides]|nr:RNA polymerase II-associated protein 3 isoform X2 [Megalops cyprinoides]XP_036376134.1 RNA polymerase II-associated protein 3 isoform X2 [Megalops cyprinoides]XP_036376135.1 RNA polymerase II-associated protein 3 isoform X2 [Megalops cyprinoides]XP_036376136.1 RNA polymerase II-associated protein 3 isoform X2 [Megalops cyprinoides]XP_036376137.1 RNA polymerase II-associated protein 3 isoform X2 [Megalops cyprinoides]XP_036376138.1 RNA polymerase II-associated protein 3 isoform X2 [Megalops 